MAIAVFHCKACGQEFSKWYRSDKHVPKTKVCPDCAGKSSFVKVETAAEVTAGIKRYLI